MSFPLFKLGALAIKTISKPISKALVEYVAEHPRLRSICAQYGQIHHNMTSRIKIRGAGHVVTDIKPLNEVRLSQNLQGLLKFSKKYIYIILMMNIWDKDKTL